jgi:predicted lipoprotein with Yx(FWY)xxD motif
MRLITIPLTIGLLALAGCGSDDDGSSDGAQAPPATTTEAATAPSTTESTPAPASDPEPERTGTQIDLGESDYGTMLFGPKQQAIYIFERDSEDTTVCYDDCAAAWPPVYTKGEPQAGKGVKEKLLGTVKRRDGKLQVTYAGKPLYYYANEGPGEVRCHNVNLNGGFWWVVGPDGKRRA